MLQGTFSQPDRAHEKAGTDTEGTGKQGEPMGDANRQGMGEGGVATMITRQGICLLCGTLTTLKGIKPDDDANRFYWGDTITCPVCSLREVKMEIVP